MYKVTFCKFRIGFFISPIYKIIKRYLIRIPLDLLENFDSKKINFYIGFINGLDEW